MPVTRIERVLQRLRANGPATVRTLGEVIGASQPTVSRLLRTAGDQIVAIGRASAALRRRSGSAWARPRVAAVSRRLRGPAPSHRDVARVVWGQFYFVADLRVDWLRGEFADGLLPSLPWFMDDMRPQGFLGRAFAHRVAPSLRLPIDLARWTDDDALTALLWRGTDVAGDLVLGDTALDVAMQSVAAPIERDARRAAYARLAEAAMAGDLVGSSAAGEPPKFTACIRDAAGQPQQVIVKFSGPLVGQGVGRRWADLLWAEHVANRVLTDAGVDTAATEVVRVADRCMLQSARFDRVGDSGRTGFVTLAALDDACFGSGATDGLRLDHGDGCRSHHPVLVVRSTDRQHRHALRQSRLSPVRSAAVRVGANL